MAGSISNYAENLIVKWLFTAASVTRPTSWYIQLHSGAPGENGTGSPIGVLGRKSVTFAAPADGRIANTATITFTIDAGLSAKATHFTIWDASSGGNCLGWGTLAKALKFGGTGGVGGDGRTQMPTSRSFPAGSFACVARGLTLFARHLALNWLFRTASVTRPSAWFMAVHRMPPNDLGAGGELAGSGATREAIGFAAPANGVAASDGDVVFGPAVGSWPRLSHYSIWDAETGGNCLQTKATKTTYDVAGGGSLKFAAGSVILSVQ